MKKYIKFLSLAMIIGFSACTSDFEELNVNPSAISSEDASAAYFLTKPEYKLFAPSRYYYWRANLIHADRYAGYFCFGSNGCWWSDELGYTFSGGYTQATWEMYGDYFRYINTLLKVTAEGGDFDNPLSNAVALVLKSVYYQQYTDVFGNVPYSEAGDPSILLPKFDSQKSIYEGLITDLDKAMAVIGSSAITGEGVENIADNDLIFAGDLQQWKAFANSLKLRIAMRALGAPDAGFADAAVKSALGADLMELGPGAIISKDNAIDQFESSSYGDIWHRFGGLGSKWKVSETMINYLQSNNDPRLSRYAKPASGGSIEFAVPAEDVDGFNKRVDFIKATMDKAGAVYTAETVDSTLTISLEADKYYLGLPTRLNSKIKGLARAEFFSDPQDHIISADPDSDDILPEIVMTTAEVFFLRAEAAAIGYGGDAQTLLHSAITSAMEFHGVDAGAISEYLSAADLAQLNGSADQNLEKINVQRWIASYTDGFEGWSIVRKSGFPSELSAGVSDLDIFGLGDINGDYPTRMQYGPGAYDLNGTNVEAAVSEQGADKQNTKLWWAK